MAKAVTGQPERLRRCTHDSSRRVGDTRLRARRDDDDDEDDDDDDNDDDDDDD
ncbi:MAG: hypothetical protein M1832_005748 [Thelocarpon impressellum]|nr:MAG: hypothetical protein M1832_005748 [Thelocarpon impressellum]